MDGWITISSAVSGLIVGGVITFLTTRAQLRIAAEHAYDRSLRDMRLPHYQQLFHLSESLPREWGAPGPPNKRQLLAVRERFHSWFFSENAGGMFLSLAAREAYFALQNELQTAASQLATDTETAPDLHSSELRIKASALRHQLAADLGVSEQPRNAWTRPQSIPAPRR
jgi:hypothetical protein